MKLLIGQEESDGPYYTIPEEDILLAIEIIKEQHHSDICHGRMTIAWHEALMKELCVYENLLVLIKEELWKTI